MMRRSPPGRRGFTIIEILTALTIIGIIGLAMTKLILGQTRSFQYDNGARRARAAARSAMNILITDLRMTQDNGGVTAVDLVNNRRIDVRVPTVFGFVCEVTGGGVVVSLVPSDSFQLASSKYGGYAVRDPATGIYSYASAASTDSMRSAGAGRCRGGVNIYADTARIAGRTGGVFYLSPAPPAITVVGTARFSYYTQNPYATRDVPTTTAPASLNNLRGFQIYLPAESSDTMPTRNTPQSANATTAVFFKNTRFP